MGKIICKKCNIEAKEVILDSYEYEEGIPLRNINAYECHNCKEFIFNEDQVEEMEKNLQLLR